MAKAIEGAELLAGAVGMAALVFFSGGAAIAAMAPFLEAVAGGMLAGGVSMEVAAIVTCPPNPRG